MSFSPGLLGPVFEERYRHLQIRSGMMMHRQFVKKVISAVSEISIMIKTDSPTH